MSTNLTSRKVASLTLEGSQEELMQMNGQGAKPLPLEMAASSWHGFARAEGAPDEFFHPTDGLGPDDGGGQCWRELHSTGRRGVVWTNGGSNCPKEAAWPLQPAES